MSKKKDSKKKHGKKVKNKEEVSVLLEVRQNDCCDRLKRSFVEWARREVFDMMLKEEIEAYEALSNFVVLEADTRGSSYSFEGLLYRIERADWNTTEYRESIATELAELEANIAYYGFISHLGSNSELAVLSLGPVQEQIDYLVQLYHEFKILVEIENFNLIADNASVALNNALDKRDELESQLKNSRLASVQD